MEKQMDNEFLVKLPTDVHPFDAYFEAAWSGTSTTEKRIGRTISVYAWNAAITAVFGKIASGTTDNMLDDLDKMLIR